MKIFRFLLGIGVIAVFLIVGILWRLQQRYGSGDLGVTFFDVGQGDAALVQFPKGKTMMVDAGGGFDEMDMGTRLLVKELARLGILEIDVAFLSHPDWDHGYGFRGIFKNLFVREFWLNEFFTPEKDNPFQNKIMNDLFELAKGVRIMRFKDGISYDWEGVRVRVIPAHSGKESNSRSLVLLLEFYRCRVLFTGDIGEESEKEIVGYLKNKLGIEGRIHLIKVPHHGSRFSSNADFVTKLRPQWVIASLAYHNRYGHPHPTVIRRYEKYQAQFFRTDFHGFVKFSFSPDGAVLCESFQGFCGRASCD